MIKSLSKQEYDLLSTFAIKNRKVITVEDVKESFNFTDGKIRVMLHRLEKKGWLERIEKGKYLIVPLEGREGWAEHPFIPLSKLVTNYYVSYRTALAHYGFTEQMPFYVFAATTERKKPLEFQGYLYKFIRVSKRKFFGFVKIKISDTEINIADKEKTIIDCLDREEYAGSVIEIFKALYNNKEQFDFDKMINYALQIKNYSLIRRLGFLLDLIKQDTKALEGRIGKFRYVYLSNTLPKKRHGASKKWRLILNLKEEELFKW